MASRFLYINFERNRAVNDNSLGAFSSAITEGNFSEFSPIRVVRRGGRFVLTDGQHRLNAIFQSGLCATLTVIVVDDDEITPKIDYANADSIAFKKSIRVSARAARKTWAKLPTVVLKAFSSACKWIESDFEDTQGVNLLDAFGIMDKWADEANTVDKWIRESGVSYSGATLVGLLNSGPFASAILSSRENGAKPQEFWTAVAIGGEPDSHPSTKLREYLLANRKKGYRASIDMAIRYKYCWLKFKSGDSVERMPRLVDFPSEGW
jgi:hypothetical protein